VWAAIRYRRLQALVLLALSALITACTVLAPLYDRAMQQALTRLSVDSAPASATAVQLRSLSRYVTEADRTRIDDLEPGRLRGTGDHNRPRIIKTNNLPIRPMSIEEAALRLDDSKNEFIVFRDLDTDRVSVIYKRRDDNLGLIAPEV